MNLGAEFGHGDQRWFDVPSPASTEPPLLETAPGGPFLGCALSVRRSLPAMLVRLHSPKQEKKLFSTS